MSSTTPSMQPYVEPVADGDLERFTEKLKSVPLTPNASVSGLIYFTDDLSIIKLYQANRPVHRSAVESLKRGIHIDNLLPDNPILVTHDYVVLDGQTRLTAARELGCGFTTSSPKRSRWTTWRP